MPCGILGFGKIQKSNDLISVEPDNLEHEKRAG
jgi:hypothetical protein